MRKLLDIFISGIPLPRPKLRARPIRINGKWGAQVYLRLAQYDKLPSGKRRRRDWDAQKWHDRIVKAVRENRPAVPALKGGIRLDVDYYFHRPGYMMTSAYDVHPIKHSIRPDRTNLDKLLEDAITACNTVIELDKEVDRPCVWADDGQVCEGESLKWYCARDGHPDNKPGARIVISSLVDIEPELFAPEKETPVHPARLLPGRPQLVGGP